MMKVDWFIADLGLGDIELTDEFREALKLHARAFFLGGGSVSWERWAMLSEESRTAFAEAGAELRKHTAAIIALFIVDPKAALKEVGGDDAVVRAALEAKL